MTTSLQIAGLVTLWAVTLLLVPGATRDGKRRTLWAVIALVAIELTLYRPAIQAPLYSLVNGHVVFVGVHLVSVVEAIGALYLLVAMLRRGQHRLLVVGLGAVAAAAMIVVYVTAHPATPSLTEPPRVPLLYWHILSVFHAATHLLASALCGSLSRRVGPGAMRLSLLALAVGMLLLCVPWALNLGWLLTDDAAWVAPIAPIDAVTGLFVAVSAAPPLVAGAPTTLRRRAATRQLKPLWRDLTQSVPEIVFSPSTPGIGTPRRWRFSLYRQVVEIRDAMLALRDYVDPAALQLAQEHVRKHEPDSRRWDAATTACWLAAARIAKASGAEARTQTGDVTGAMGDNLDEEIEHLSRVARLYRSSLVERYLVELHAKPAAR